MDDVMDGTSNQSLHLRFEVLMNIVSESGS